MPSVPSIPWLRPRPEARLGPELMDLPGQDRALLAGTFEDLRRINRWLGGCRLTTQALDRLVAQLPTGSHLSILDVATGAADIPEAVLGWAAKRGLRARVVATDLNPVALGLVPSDLRRRLDLVVADARRLPFSDGSFDVATCSLVLHHFGPEEATTVLREMRRVARLGVVVNDLVRCWHGYLGAWLLGRTLTSNPLTRHDGPLSVRRAYTRAEMADLAARAGLGRVSFLGFLGYRVAMVAAGQP